MDIFHLERFTPSVTLNDTGCFHATDSVKYHGIMPEEGERINAIWRHLEGED